MTVTGYGLCFQGGKSTDPIIAKRYHSYWEAVNVIEALEII